MKKRKSNMTGISDNTSIAEKRINPFIKLMKDKERISEAIKNNVPLSSLKDIKFVHPI
jgi:hypothetical protein